MGFGLDGIAVGIFDPADNIDAVRDHFEGLFAAFRRDKPAFDADGAAARDAGDIGRIVGKRVVGNDLDEREACAVADIDK